MYSNWTCVGGVDGKPEHPFAPASMSYHDSVCTKCGAARPKSNESDNTSIKRSDPILFNTLSCLNLASAYTTMTGANQILPVIGYPTGAAIQLMLFLLVSGSAGKKLPKNTKWTAIGIFSILSIYTSFFGFYSGIGSNSDASNELTRAKKAHQEIVQDLYTPLNSYFKSLPGLIKDKSNQIKIEEECKGVTGQCGKGQKWKELTAKKIELETDYSSYGEILKSLDVAFNYNLEQKENAREILNSDIAALSKVPSKWLTDDVPKWFNKISPDRLKKYRNQELFKSNYIDPDTEMGILAPYQKIIKGEPRAIMAGLLALMLDGTIILLGAALDYRRKVEVKVPSTRNASKIIDDLRQSIKGGQIEINDELRKECIYLLDAMKDRGWLTLSNKSGKEIWSITPEKEKKLYNWFQSERSRCINQETNGKKIKKISDGYQTFFFPDDDDDSNN